MTDEEIAQLIKIPKLVTNPAIRGKENRKSIQRTYTLESEDGSETFELYVRKNTKDHESYSCGLVYHRKRSGEKIPLLRYNGSCHQHTNPLEGRSTIDYACHIHRATQRYIEAGHRPDQFAEQTDRYSDISGALVCILQDCNISGLEVATTDDSYRDQLHLDF